MNLVGFIHGVAWLIVGYWAFVFCIVVYKDMRYGDNGRTIKPWATFAMIVSIIALVTL